MKRLVNFNIKRTAAALSAAVMLTSSAAVIPASAETAPAYSAIEYSISGLSTPKITKAAKTTNSVTLKWTKVKGAAGYKVYKKVGTKYKVVGTVKGGSKVRFKVKKLKSGTKYSFKVRAYKKSGRKTTWSRYSGAKSVVTKADYSKFIPYMESCAQLNSEFDAERSIYMLEDLDRDGVKELLVVPDSSQAMRQIFIYSYNHGDPKLSDSTGFGHSVLLKKNNKYTIFYGHQGYWGAYRFKLKNGKIKSSCLATGEIGPDEEYPISKYGSYVPAYAYADKNAFYI